MSEIMRPIEFGALVKWVLDEYRQNKTIFGLASSKFYRNESGNMMKLFGESLDSPVGPAAGPHSQLAQNIVTSYLAGSRFIELKTVQTMDGEELRKCVARPCINAEDEGYNVEWSTELKVSEAFDEYVKAWFLIHVLAKELGISQECDFAFNMSVGYNLEGIQSEKIDSYIEGLKDATDTAIFKECAGFIKENLDLFENFTENDLNKVSPCVARSVTLSTLHGCPKEEIERIAVYLLTEKKVHTYIKCNPTLLGYEFAREKLDELGYHYISFDDHHFNNDLQFSDAVFMFNRLIELSQKENLQFGLKLTNTFPVQIKNKELPGEEMYMSGRSLYPLTISLASKLATEFNGKLPISYSGGADHFNISEILKAGIQPITVATTLLKPGGYARLYQIAKTSESSVVTDWNGLDISALQKIAAEVSQNKYHQKSFRTVESRKTDVPLGLLECFMAPCKESGCPIHQQIPEYLKLVSDEKYVEAMQAITIDNSSPAVLGRLCTHKCQTKCTRIDYDESLKIRSMKGFAVLKGGDDYINTIKETPIRTNKKAVCIGAGPAGVAAAYYLRRNGVDVTVLEKRDSAYGIVSHVIPEFRISKDLIEKDITLAEKTGVKFVYGVDSGYDLEELKKEYDYVILATGAWGRGNCGLVSGEDKLLDALEFLAESKQKDCKMDLGESVAVIGGGDVAMDCARAAKRSGSKVSLVYRRTKEFMPAEKEEIELAIQDGVEIMELLAPISYDGTNLLCDVMELTEVDRSGRRGVKATGEQKTLVFSTVISAIGAKVELEQFEKNKLELDGKYVKQNENYETSVQNVYIAGDCRVGASTIVKALADSKRVAIDILNKEKLTNDFVKVGAVLEPSVIWDRKGNLCEVYDDNQEGKRCLACDEICAICCDVCPNRANVLLPNNQILHIDGMCNECGNCGKFCPHTGDPYKDKFTLFWTEEDFVESKQVGFLVTDNGYKVRNECGEVVETSKELEGIIKPLQDMIKIVPQRYL